MTGVILQIIGIALGLGGLLVLGAALFRDRARGRARCPRCWYALDGTSTTCPECGREIARTGELYRTRRRWRRAVVGGVTAGVGAFVGLSLSRSADPVRWIPDMALVTVAPLTVDEWAGAFQGAKGTRYADELLRRQREGVLSARAGRHWTARLREHMIESGDWWMEGEVQRMGPCWTAVDMADIVGDSHRRFGMSRRQMIRSFADLNTGALLFGGEWIACGDHVIARMPRGLYNEWSELFTPLRSRLQSGEIVTGDRVPPDPRLHWRRHRIGPLVQDRSMWTARGTNDVRGRVNALARAIPPRDRFWQGRSHLMIADSDRLWVYADDDVHEEIDETIRLAVAASASADLRAGVAHPGIDATYARLEREVEVASVTGWTLEEIVDAIADASGTTITLDVDDLESVSLDSPVNLVLIDTSAAQTLDLIALIEPRLMWQVTGEDTIELIPIDRNVGEVAMAGTPAVYDVSDLAVAMAGRGVDAPGIVAALAFRLKFSDAQTIRSLPSGHLVVSADARDQREIARLLDALAEVLRTGEVVHVPDHTTCHPYGAFMPDNAWTELKPGKLRILRRYSRVYWEVGGVVIAWRAIFDPLYGE